MPDHYPAHGKASDRLRELGWFSLKKGKLQGDLVTGFQYLKEA